MSKYTDEQRSEILQRHQAGEDEQAIAQAMGVNPFGVRSVINWSRVKAGEIPDPLAGQRGRKPKEEGELEPGAVPSVKVQIGSPRAATRKSSVPTTDGVPIFAGGAVRLEVHRIRANPSSAGEGYLADEDGAATLALIKDRFGGGLYEFRAFAAAGAPLGRRRETLSGPSVSVENEPASNSYWPVVGAPDNRMLEMWERQRIADEQRRRDELEREERRRQDEREREERRAQLERERVERQAQSEREWLAAQQVMSREQSHTMIQLLTSVLGNQKGTSLTDVIAAAGALRDLTDGGPEDATAALITQGPKLLEGLKDLARMRSNGAAGPPDESGLTDQQLAEAALKRLIAQGLTREEAMKHLQTAFGYLDQKISEKRQLQTRNVPAARRAPPPAPPSGNGASGTAVAAGSTPHEPPQSEAKA